MRGLFFCFFVLFLLAACYTPSSDCKQFKTGVFEYQTYANGELIKAKIVRNDSLEIDYYNPAEPDTSQIRWINDCEYILKKYQPRSNDEKRSFSMRIIGTDKNSYTFIFSELGKKYTKEFTAIRLKEEE